MIHFHLHVIVLSNVRRTYGIFVEYVGLDVVVDDELESLNLS